MLSWIYLMGAIFLEVLGTICLKMSDGFTKLSFAAGTYVFYGASFILLGLVLKKIDVGTAYAIWSGLGTAIIAVIGYYFFQDTLTPMKIISIALIITGVVGLNLSGLKH